MLAKAFSCLLLAAAAVAQTPLGLEVVATGLFRPVLVTAPPNDLERIFIVEQVGRVRIVKNGVLLPTPFMDFAGLGQLDFGGERGLLGMAFHPDFDQNGEFYIFRNALPSVTVVVERYTVSAGNPDVADMNSQTLLLTQPGVFGNHNGGSVAFGADGYLYVSIGDGGSTGPSWPSDPFNYGQNGQSLLAKILRLDVDNPQPPLQYGIPASNPFAGDPTVLDEIWAIGVRNPWRCTFDRLTGDFYVADVGGLREEINFEPAGSPGGRNYGWSCMSGNNCTGLTVCTCFDPALTSPMHVYWPPSGGRAVIGGYVYRGCAIPDLRGSYFYADYVFDEIWSLRHNGTAVTQLTDRTGELVPPAPHMFTGITAFGEDAMGELYICNLSGEVYRIVPTGPAIVGVQTYGVGTPGCSGPHAMAAACTPVIGNPDFALTCNNAPASSLGLMAFADAPDVAGSDPLNVGLTVHLQVTASFFSIWAMSSDLSGEGSFSFAIPASQSLIGMQLYAQSIWAWDPAVCSPSLINWSSSPGLAFTVQP